MKRTTLMLPPQLKERALRRARSLGISLGELIRESLAAALSGARDRVADDPLFADTAVYAGEAPADLSARHDRYLYGRKENR